MDPINYSGMLTQIDLSPLQRGLALGRAKREWEAEQGLRQQRFDAEQAAKAETQGRKQAFMDRWKQVADAPTAEGYNSLRADFPDQLETISAGQKPFDERQRLVGRDVATGIYSHILGGDNQAAIGAIDTGIEQFGAAGRPLTSLQTLRGMLATGKPNQVEAAKRVASMLLAQEAGEQYGSVLSSLSRESQSADLMPDRLRRADADADFAETRAAYAPEQQREQLRGRRVRNANTADLLHRREQRPPPRAPLSTLPIPIKPGEQTARDASGAVFVVRGGRWVRAQ